MQSDEFDFSMCEVYMENDKKVLHDWYDNKLK